MGPLPLDWTQIKSWADLEGLELEPKESRALRTLSNIYLDQHSKAKKNDCPQPWIDPEQLRSAEVAEKVTQQFKDLVKKRKNKSG